MFSFDFTIWVKAYDQVETIKNNETVIDWVDGGEIELSPTKTGGVGKHGRVGNIGSFLVRSFGTSDHVLAIVSGRERRYIFVCSAHSLHCIYRDYILLQ